MLDALMLITMHLRFHDFHLRESIFRHTRFRLAHCRHHNILYRLALHFSFQEASPLFRMAKASPFGERPASRFMLSLLHGDDRYAAACFSMRRK